MCEETAQSIQTQLCQSKSKDKVQFLARASACKIKQSQGGDRKLLPQILERPMVQLPNFG